MFKICGIKFCTKESLAALVLISCITVCVTELFSAVPKQGQDDALHKFVMMSDGKDSKAVPVEEFFKVVLKDAGKNNKKEEFEEILKLKQNLDLEAFPTSSDAESNKINKLGGNGLFSKDSIKNFLNSGYKNSFVVDTVKECFTSAGQSVKSIAKSVIKGVAVGATMGVVLLIGGAIVWQVFIIPAYCKGPGPVIADWLPVPEYWGSGEDGICQNYARQDKILAQEAKLKRAAELISASVPAVVLPDGSFNPEIPGYCKIDANGEVIWCDKSLCKIDSNIRGC